MDASNGACEYCLCSQLHISPPQLCHTLPSSAGLAGLGRRLLQGRIRLHKLYSIFLQPASLYAATTASHHICFNCSHSCEIPCIPVFYGCPLSQPFLISLFASLAFPFPLPHLFIFSKLFVLVYGGAFLSLFFFFFNVISVKCGLCLDLSSCVCVCDRGMMQSSS